MCHTVNITDDNVCENEPNEQFFSDLSYVSGIQPVNIDPARATVIIDDSAEPECGKCIVCVSISSSEANELVLCHIYF